MCGARGIGATGGSAAPVESAPHIEPRKTAKSQRGDYKCMCGAVGSGATHAATSDGRTSSASMAPRRLGVWRRQEGSHMGMCGARRGATQKVRVCPEKKSSSFDLCARLAICKGFGFGPSNRDILSSCSSTVLTSHARRWFLTSTHSRHGGTIFNIHHIAIYIRDGGKHSTKYEDLADKLQKHDKVKASSEPNSSAPEKIRSHGIKLNGDTRPLPDVNTIDLSHSIREPGFSFDANMAGFVIRHDADKAESSHTRGKDKDKAVPRDRPQNDDKRYLAEEEPPLRGGEHQREKSSPAGIRRENSLPEGEIDAIAIVIERDIISIIIIIISTIYTAITTAAPRISMNEVRKKLFTISLSGKAAHWYKLLKNGDSIDWEDIVPLFYSKFYPPSEIHKDRNRIYNFWPHDGEYRPSLGRLKSLMLKCPIHELPGNVIIDNFYARLSFQDKTLLDTSCSGSFTRKNEEFKRDLLDRIQENTEGWENDKDRESQHLENSESEAFRKERDELEEIFRRQPILKHDLPVEDLGTTPPPKEDPVFDLKPLPDNLKYAHIDDKKIYPVIISSKLSEIEEERICFGSRSIMSSSGTPKDSFFEDVVNPYMNELKMHPKELQLVGGELQIKDVQGPKGEGSLEDRMEKLEQEVFNYKKMAEREVDIFHKIVSELIDGHKKEIAKLWDDIFSLHDTTNKLQAQLYDVHNQNREYENRFKRISHAASFRFPETKMSFVDGGPLPWKSDDDKDSPSSPKE
ncbi:hypothetical protein QYE76_010359 [Lolium multiflorum]|uniref:Retrotransposon gag domain-containing protein n=1 Tax=Lolium multiflorum TaxID=4521 RepID=A0AAD8X495_LOLMU|nr:hypothetical protein QYE76_010359 [Lolium multiflorum]